VQDLHEALQGAALESAALTTLRNNVAALLQNEQFQELRRDLPELRAPLENIRSITIGINLDAQLLPSSAVLLAVNDVQLGQIASLLNRLIGAREDEDDDSGIAPLHVLPHNKEERPLSSLFQDLDRILAQVAQPVARALTRYVKTGSGWLANLEYEFAFFIAATRLMQRLSRQGIPVCQPEIAPVEDRITMIDGLVNPLLAIRGGNTPVASGAHFGADGRIAILTGPNSGGKTTYLRSVGLAHMLFQAGLFVPAQSARLSPVDAILTHFPALETRQQGRLAEEAVRLRGMFQHMTQHSLVLLNETFSSTSSGEAMYLAQDVLCALRAIGVRAVFATHLIELAEHIPEMEAAVSGDSRLISLVAGLRLNDDGQAAPTFEIAPGLPLGRSYAQEIARRNGISLEQILQARQRSTGDESA
jgi:DNA mismatch repair ATPase MutS